MMMEVITVCPFCGEAHSVFVNEEGFFAWRDKGVCIQDALPDLSPAERELLISGVCSDCWKF